MGSEGKRGWGREYKRESRNEKGREESRNVCEFVPVWKDAKSSQRGARSGQAVPTRKLWHPPGKRDGKGRVASNKGKGE